MITFFNRLGNSWVAKIIFGALALSMLAFWGLGGLSNVSTYDTSNDAVRVGKTGVSTAQLHQAFEFARKRLSQFSGGTYISPTQAVNMGILDQVIQQEVAGAVQHQIGEELGLTASNKAIQNYVENNPVFHDNTGKFDKNMFYGYLMQSGLSETQLAYKLKKELAFKHLTDSVQGLGYAPEILAKAAYAYKNEKRDIDALLLNPENVTVTAMPTEQEIQDYYEAYAENFMNPEFRTITVMALTPDMMIDRIQINQAQIDELFEEQKDKYNKPEERDLYQMFFKDKAAADAMIAKVNTENFEQLATTEAGQSAADTHFGMTAKNQLMEELGDPVFTAQKGDIVGPIASQVGFHILWVKDIKAAETTPAETVKAEIRKSLTFDKAYGDLEDLSRQVQDILGTGTTLADASKQLNISTTQIQKTDIAGNLASGSEFPKEYSNSELLREIFVLKKGDVSNLIRQDNGYLIAQLDEIIPVSQKELAAVKDEIKSLWIKEQQEKLFPNIVKELTEKVKKGMDLNVAATEKGTFTVINKTGVLRSTTVPELHNALNDVFTQNAGAENAISVPTGKGSAIVIVRRITKADLENADTAIKVEAENTKHETGTTLNQQTVQSYTKGFGIQVNQQKIDQLIKSYKGQE